MDSGFHRNDETKKRVVRDPPPYEFTDFSLKTNLFLVRNQQRFKNAFQANASGRFE